MIKTNILTIILILIFFTTVYGGGDKTETTTVVNTTRMIDLSPIVPKEATFEDVEDVVILDMNKLRPITPKEATFEDDTITYNKTKQLQL